MRAKKSEVPKLVHTAIKVLSPSGRAIFYDSRTLKKNGCLGDPNDG